MASWHGDPDSDSNVTPEPKYHSGPNSEVMKPNYSKHHVNIKLRNP